MREFKLKVDGDLLTKAYIEETKIFDEEINEAFEKIGFISDHDKGWICSLCFRLGVKRKRDRKNELEIVKALIDEQTPKNLAVRFGLPELIDTYDFNLEKIAAKHKEFVGIFYLAMARNISDLSYLSIGRNEYLDCVSLGNIARESFTMYLCEIKQNTRSSLLAKFNAHKRHAETYELKQQALGYWRAHIDPKLSNPRAADLLIKVVPVSHRKLVEYVAEAKRENIRPAS